MDFEQYKDRITELIEANINSITKKQLRKAITSEFDVDFSECKAEFDEYAMSILQGMLQKKEKVVDTIPEVEIDTKEIPNDSDDDSVLIDTPKKKSNGGLCSLSPALSELLNATELGRMQVTKQIWDYIKARNLQDEKDKRFILCDEKLHRVFKTKRLHMMKMATLLQPHLTPIAAEKKPKKQKNSNGDGEPKRGGFNKHYQLSTELQQLIQVDTESRPQVVKKIWDYIKANDLQDPSNKQNILNDDLMYSVFKTKKMTMFEMNKLISEKIVLFYMLDPIVRPSIATMSAWAQQQTCLQFLDFFCVWFIYSQVRPNASVFLLAILSTVKLETVIWLMTGADYNSGYSDSLCYAIWIGCEFGWFVNDHIASISTYHKLASVSKEKQWLAVGSKVILCCSLAVGAILRILRNMCRFNNCILPEADTPISINVLLTELVLVLMLTYYLYDAYKNAPVKSNSIGMLIDNGLLRIVCLLPLGILEALDYYMEYIHNAGTQMNPSLLWFVHLGVDFRLMYPTILSLAIVLTKLRIKSDATSMVASKKATGQSKGESEKSKVMLDPIVRVSLSAMSEWAQQQTCLQFLDFFCVWFIYSQAHPNSSILLLAFLSTIKLQTVIWLMTGADYDESYSDSLCAAIWIGCEFGWYVNDHIASISTYFKLSVVMRRRSILSLGAKYLLIGSCTTGVVLRVLRNLCRFNICILEEADAPISINVLITELMLIFVLTHYLYGVYTDNRHQSMVLSGLLENGLLRVVCLLPLGILEALDYYLEYLQSAGTRMNPSLMWFVHLGVDFRLLYPTILSMAIILTKLKIKDNSAKPSEVSFPASSFSAKSKKASVMERAAS
ncbi:hypothetical protein HDV06_004808 [Boothiomyces sp. JEL0866]|nr:hypothetical protein HDV06_004808 [Boothiomyces sp. JEL0866]